MDIANFKVIDVITANIVTNAVVRDYLNKFQAKGNISHITLNSDSVAFCLKLPNETEYNITLTKPRITYSSDADGNIFELVRGYQNNVSMSIELFHSKDTILNLAKVSDSDKQYSRQELLKIAANNLEKSKSILDAEMQNEQPIIPFSQMITCEEIIDASTEHNPYIHGPKHNTHYWICVDNVNYIDYYAIARLLGITDPNVQHAFKKLFALGKRSGGKDVEKDIREVIQSLELKLQLDKLIED